ncbi:endonuclease [Hymenobacter sp. RP-2-7]|uniref:Endonuclease n=1 Tax=Hymenobacter polaris TaxID=2682546 RepID=A0A7Y0FKX2_9BACT|nr:endonuclease/exonuclease/phosphatase family protein [Hymenobacter polaris]NML64197.1 endonuclease [Hymenobacter polaris]
MSTSLLGWLRTGALYLVALLGTVSVAATLLSLPANTPEWWLKLLDFPRVQTLLVALGCLVLLPLLARRWHWGTWALALGLGSAAGLQASIVLPYSPLVPLAVAQATPAQATHRAATLRLFEANVLQSNRHAADLLRLVRQQNPDVVLLEETNAWWAHAVDSLGQAYPYHMLCPLPDTYGMLLYSKYPLSDTVRRFLQHPNVPSFYANVQLPSGQRFYLCAVHPVPPVPSEHPYNKHEREAELVKVGRLLQAQTQGPGLPTLVVGDLNDVAWAHTTRLFESQANLHSVRVGRGLYATFDAKIPLLRWPLDHVFVSSQFRVVELKRLAYFGSDHFPLYCELALE